MALALAGTSLGCSTHHWAQVERTPLPTPPGEKVLHTGRLVVSIVPESEQTQCVVYEKHHPICFFNLREALGEGLVQALWPAFPEIVYDSGENVRDGDYVLQVQVTLDALPPDDSGPGWSAGAKSRFRLLRGEEVLAEQTLASRSRAHFPYGATLGEGATEVVDATIVHIAQIVSEVPESRPDKPVPLPAVAARDLSPRPNETPRTDSRVDEPTPRLTPRLPPTSRNAKTAGEAAPDESGEEDSPPPPPAPGNESLQQRK